MIALEEEFGIDFARAVRPEQHRAETSFFKSWGKLLLAQDNPILFL